MKENTLWKKACAIAGVILLLTAVLYIDGPVHKPGIVSVLWELAPEQEEAILAVESGWYSDHLPIFAREIRVQEMAAGYVRYKVLYFPFGSIERSYTRNPDGTWFFDLERELFRRWLIHPDNA